MLKSLSILLLIITTTPLISEPLGLGRVAQPDEITAWDIDVRPDGLGLPAGQGSVAFGEEIFVENCAACHGDFAEGVGRWPALAGGIGTLQDQRPMRTVGSFYPYLSTVWDFINRAMTVGYGPDLTVDEIYAVTAYLLYSNDLVGDDFVLSRDNFTSIHLPNESGFYMDNRAQVELPRFSHHACMVACKTGVKITMTVENQRE